MKVGDAAIHGGAGAGAVVGDGGNLEIKNHEGVAELAVGVGQGEVMGVAFSSARSDRRPTVTGS